jgi:ankyrin repeat protein
MKRRGLLGLALALASASAVRAQSLDPRAGSFFRAIIQDNASALRDLLLEGVDPNLRNDRGMPGLVLALHEDRPHAAQVLMNSPRLDPNELDTAGESALMMASLKGNLPVAQRLMALGARVNKPGWSPLHYAATGGHPRMIELLLQHGAQVNAHSPNDTTPLMMAAQYGTPATLTALLRAGADVNARNQQGLTALNFAQRGERPDAIKILAAALRASQPTPLGHW